MCKSRELQPFYATNNFHEYPFHYRNFQVLWRSQTRLIFQLGILRIKYVRRRYALSMKRKPFILLLVGLSACGALAWLIYSPTPAIRFLEFRDGQYGRVAVFRIVNDSDDPYTYVGYGPSSPLYSYRVPTASGWQSSSLGWCGTGAGAHTISPHTTTDFQVSLSPSSPLATPFAVGIHFQNGTAAEIQSRYRSRSRISEFFYWLRCRINPKYQGPQPTWSTVAETQ